MKARYDKAPSHLAPSDLSFSIPRTTSPDLLPPLTPLPEAGLRPLTQASSDDCHVVSHADVITCLPSQLGSSGREEQAELSTPHRSARQAREAGKPAAASQWEQSLVRSLSTAVSISLQQLPQQGHTEADAPDDRSDLARMRSASPRAMLGLLCPSQAADPVEANGGWGDTWQAQHDAALRFQLQKFLRSGSGIPLSTSSSRENLTADTFPTSCSTSSSNGTGTGNCVGAATSTPCLAPGVGSQSCRVVSSSIPVAAAALLPLRATSIPVPSQRGSDEWCTGVAVRDVQRSHMSEEQLARTVSIPAATGEHWWLGKEESRNDGLKADEPISRAPSFLGSGGTPLQQQHRAALNFEIQRILGRSRQGIKEAADLPKTSGQLNSLVFEASLTRGEEESMRHDDSGSASWKGSCFYKEQCKQRRVQRQQRIALRRHKSMGVPQPEASTSGSQPQETGESDTDTTQILEEGSSQAAGAERSSGSLPRSRTTDLGANLESCGIPGEERLTIQLQKGSKAQGEGKAKTPRRRRSASISNCKGWKAIDPLVDSVCCSESDS